MDLTELKTNQDQMEDSSEGLQGHTGQCKYATLLHRTHATRKPTMKVTLKAHY